MRSKLLLLFLTLMALNFVACKDDDSFDYTQAISGSYKGDLKVVIPDMNVNTTNTQKVGIVKVDDSHVRLELKNFSFSGTVVGSIIVNDIMLTESNGEYIMSPVATTLTFDNLGEVKINLTEGKISGNSLSLKLDVLQVLLDLNINVAFTGEKATAESSEKNITKFEITDSRLVGPPSVDNNVVIIYFADTVKSIDNIKLTPTIAVSDFATVTPASGVELDFSNPVTYTVTAEDGTTKTYTVSIQIGKYDFEQWVKGVEDQEPEKTFYEVAGGWGSSNTGAHFLKAFAMADSYVVTQTDDAHSGKSAARIETIDTKGSDMQFVKVPKVTSGSLFLGQFITDMADVLNSTKFGNVYYMKPLKLQGFYKYTPGKTFYRSADPAKPHEAVADPNSTDECMISAILYEVKDPKDVQECLTGHDLYTSGRIVGIAKLADGKAKADWTSFELTLNYVKEYNPAKHYRFVISCSSSKDGDNFNGAPGSVLVVDDFKVITE